MYIIYIIMRHGERENNLDKTSVSLFLDSDVPLAALGNLVTKGQDKKVE